MVKKTNYLHRFSSIIKAEFNGHTHSDEFKIFYNSEGRPTNVAWGAGSVTSYSFYNLNYKIATFDGATYVSHACTFFCGQGVYPFYLRG